MVLITLGILQLGELFVQASQELLKVKIKYLWFIYVLFLSAIYSTEFIMFWRTYLKVYPKVYSQEWQYGYQNMISGFEKFRTKNPRLNHQYITREYGRPAMYYFFYTLADPKDVQTAAQTSNQDQGELLEYHQIRFINNINNGLNTPALVAASPEQFNNYKIIFPDQKVNILNEIDGLNNQPIWIIFKVE